MFEMRRVAKKFDGFHTMKGFSLSLPTGSFAVLIGPSGCGGSTLFKFLMVPHDVDDTLKKDKGRGAFALEHGMITKEVNTDEIIAQR